MKKLEAKWFNRHYMERKDPNRREAAVLINKSKKLCKVLIGL